MIPSAVSAGGHSSLVLGPAASELRRRLGSTAWCALEVLTAAARAPDDPRDVVAEMTVRDVAGELGVARNTAQRALSALRAAGLVASTQRRARGGRFAAGAYVLHIPPHVLTWLRSEAISSSTTPKSRMSSRARAPRSTSSRAVEQLAFVLPR